MLCKVSDCKNRASLMPVPTGPTKWAKFEGMATIGHPHRPLASTHLCYYHLKLSGGLFSDNDTLRNRQIVGRQSNPMLVKRNGEKVVLGPDWR